MFMTSGLAATWKFQFIEQANKWPAPANPNDKLGRYTDFRKELVDVFSMFDLVGDALDMLWSLWMKTGSSINKHIAQFKLLAAVAEINANHALTIELFKETLPLGLRIKLMGLETPLKSLDNWYNWATKQTTTGTRSTEWPNEPGRTHKRRKFPNNNNFPWKERDSNMMDVDRLTFKEWTKLMKDRQCFKCQKTGHWTNEGLMTKIRRKKN